MSDSSGAKPHDSPKIPSTRWREAAQLVPELTEIYKETGDERAQLLKETLEKAIITKREVAEHNQLLRMAYTGLISERNLYVERLKALQSLGESHGWAEKVMDEQGEPIGTCLEAVRKVLFEKTLKTLE
ncbi:hypothetical protein ADUPG1_008373 [Aduncisulcus paluster]|uniref:Uncharacterized protein n=1 Tax=Aduncisulcus paluster TaxID=2918883 RepID=A0ABQ5KRR2_9EUKA|nr:hypothetical protein ADUPG1_008373 [Aduncisulcus paluster]